MKKVRKLKWKNLIKLIVMIICISFILYDISLYLFNGYSFTWLGLLTHIWFWLITISIYLDFKEQIKKTSASANSQRPKK